MALIPPDIIEEIKQRSDIVATISQYISVKRSGSNFKANCPFHKEKTPSFMISPQKQIYHCFGCHKGGNVYSFIMEYENISFVESVKKLAAESGIEINKYLEAGPGSDKYSGVKDQLMEVNDKATTIFHDELMKNQNALSYFKNRKLDENIIKEFRLGFAPDEWSFIINRFEKDELEPAIKAGLVIDRNNKKFDYFRNRVLFPIFNTAKNVIAFGGRRLNEDQNPKYLNSPETLVYNKSYVLYGLSHAVEAIKQEKSCYFVEGYMDVLRMHQHGIKNVVATSGTALTDGHARLIARYCDKVYLIYDSDDAGLNATIRSIPSLLMQKLQIFVVPLPVGSDPDTILLSYGNEKFEYFTSLAVDFIEFQFKYFSKKGLLSDEVEKAKVLNQIKEQLSHVKDEILQELLKQKVEDMFNIHMPVIPHKKEEEINISPRNDGYFSQLNADKYNLEKDIILLLLLNNNDISNNIITDINMNIVLNDKSKKIIQHFINELDENGAIKVDEIINKSQTLKTFKEMSDIKFSSMEPLILAETILKLKIKMVEKTIKYYKEKSNINSIEDINHLEVLKRQYSNELKDIYNKNGLEE